MLTVAELIAYLDVNDSAYNRKLDAAETKFDRLGGKMTNAGRTMSMAVTLPIVAAGALSVKVAAQFETSMNQVQASLDATGKQMDGLRAYAKKMGADTMFSAGEAAAAMLELAKAGMSADQIQGGGLKSALSLAAASGMDLATSAGTLSNAMHMFNITAKDSGTVADALAGAANASTAEVSDLAEGLAQVGSGAANAGLSLQDTLGILAAFADKGIQGSDAGTSLKTMLANLVPQTDKAATAMDKYGLSFVDSKGNIDDVTTVAQKLQDKLGGLSEAQRISAMNTIFGSDATRAATVLMNDGATGIQKYIDAATEKGNAEKMSEARTKGMGGAIERMTGSVETAAIVIGENMAPAVEDVAGAIEKAANWVASLDEGWQKVIITSGLVIAGIGPMLIIFGKLFQGVSLGIRSAKGVGSWLGGLRGGKGSTTMTTAAGTSAEVGVGSLGRASEIAALQVGVLGRAASTGATGSGGLSSAGQRGAGLMNQGARQSYGKSLGSTMTGVGITPLERAAQKAAPQLERVGTTSRTASPRLGGLGSAAKTATSGVSNFTGAVGNSTVGAVAGTIGLSLALGYTIPKVIEAGDAFMGWMDALGQEKEAREGRQATAENFRAKLTEKYGSVQGYLDYLAEKYGKDSSQYRNALDALQIGGNGGGKAKKAVSGGKGPVMFPQASGGDYLVTKPTLFLAGEAGKERATFTPMGKSAGGGTGDVTLNLVINVDKVVGADRKAARSMWDSIKPIALSELKLKEVSGRG